MDSNIKAALQVLGFDNVSFLPMMKEIRKQYLFLSRKIHPDKPGGSKEEFQLLLDAYNLFGEAIANVDCDQDDQEEVAAREMFKQFKVNSITENSDTFTWQTTLIKSSQKIWALLLTWAAMVGSSP